MANLQYQLSNGNWVDCGDRTEEFLTACGQNNGPHEKTGEIAPLCSATRPATRDEVLAALDAGRELRNAPADWYSVCRYEPELHPEISMEMVGCSCGHSIPRSQVMSASMGTSCPDCYDRMGE